jgi:hypothetical protein
MLKTILKWLKRLVLGLITLIVILGLLGATYQAAAGKADEKRYPPPGQLVDVGGYRMHIHCMGEGSPTVILEAANMGTVSNWAWIQPEIARTTRVCAYDRADLGWSDLSPTPSDTRQNAEALHMLLEKAGESGPFVLAVIPSADCTSACMPKCTRKMWQAWSSSKAPCPMVSNNLASRTSCPTPRTPV